MKEHIQLRQKPKQKTENAMLGNHAFEAGESDLGMTAMPPTFQLAAGDTPKPPNGQEDSASGEALENGTLKSITTQMGEGISKGGDAAVKDDEASTVSTGANVETELNLSFNQKESEGSKGGKKDPVAAKVANGTFKQPGGLPVSAFGSEDYEPSFSGISYKFSGGKCIITANLDLSCPWGTNSGGCIDVPTAKDAVVTKANWKTIVSDLTPSKASPHKSPRTKYYSKKLVERHEQFHGTDDLGWTKSSGLGIVKKLLKAGNVNKKTASVDVAKLLTKAKNKLISENFKWYKGGGSSHGSYAGEIRAYADGRPHYQTLANAVSAHGKKLK